MHNQTPSGIPLTAVLSLASLVTLFLLLLLLLLLPAVCIFACARPLYSVKFVVLFVLVDVAHFERVVKKLKINKSCLPSCFQLITAVFCCCLLYVCVPLITCCIA